MKIWHAAIDESGTHNDTSHVVVSSVIGRSEEWPTVFSDWQGVLDQFQVTHYHATEFNGGKGVASHLTKEERIDCVKKLISVISEADLEYLSYALNRSLFENVIKGFPSCHLTLYDYLLTTILGDLRMRLLADVSQSQDQVKGVITIEDGCPLDSPLSTILERATRNRIISPIENISRNDKKYKPLQIADMIAYDSFRTIDSGSIDYEKRRIKSNHLRKSFEKITAGNPLRFMVIDEGWLRKDIPVAMDFLDNLK